MVVSGSYSSGQVRDLTRSVQYEVNPPGIVTVDASGLVVPGAGRLVAVLGMDDVVVIDTPDAVLVTTRARAQEVKSLVAQLQARARLDLL